MIMEAEKSHDLLPASWRTRKASDMIQSKPEDLRTRSSDVQGQKMDMPAQEERIHSSYLLFYVGPQQSGLFPPRQWGYICFTKSTDSNANLSQKLSHKYTQK